jgi:hypothetical protein
MTNPSNGPQIPNIPLNIISTPVVAKSRKLKMSWSLEAADDLRSAWRATSAPSRPDNALDLLNDALEDPNYDPNSSESYVGRYRWGDGTLATPEEIKKAFGAESSLVASMANEMSAEIDREILRSITGKV